MNVPDDLASDWLIWLNVPDDLASDWLIWLNVRNDLASDWLIWLDVPNDLASDWLIWLNVPDDLAYDWLIWLNVRDGLASDWLIWLNVPDDLAVEGTESGVGGQDPLYSVQSRCGLCTDFFSLTFSGKRDSKKDACFQWGFKFHIKNRHCPLEVSIQGRVTYYDLVP